MTEADFDRVIGTNLKGCVMSVLACLLARISHQRSRLTRCGAREGVGDRRS
jgi:hypothetical protein